MDYKVYAKPNASGYITAVNSSAFLSDPTGWTKIDSGYGDKYHHAQDNYFTVPIITNSNVYRYKLTGRKSAKCTKEEIVQQENGFVRKSDTDTIPEARVGILEGKSVEMKEASLLGLTE